MPSGFPDHGVPDSESISANCKDISFDTIDEYYEKIMKVYQ